MLHCTEIGEDGLLSCGAPARNFASLAAIWRGKGEGEGRGGPGLFVGEARGRNGRGLRGFKRGVIAGVSSN
jgi:hypothetical protein